MEAPVQPGDILAGKYRVDRVLGVGGMGVVVAAFDTLLERRVAIKFLLSAGTENPEVVARFAREARSAARIESEHVARVIDVGALPTGAPYMVMEYLDGHDLAKRISDHGTLPVEEAVDYVLQACEAIAEAHALGIVHRDLKPANLFLTRRTDGSAFVKVLDFGISKAAAGSNDSQPDMSLTKTSAVMGSPLYMAPEQMRSTRKVDARADLWALGVILYELISGRVPFEAETMTELCAMVLMEAPPSLRERCPTAPDGVVAAVDRCLQKNPAERFANISELANALAPFAPPRARHSVERISRVLRAAGVNTTSVAPPSDTPAVSAPAPAPRAGESTSAAWSPATTSAPRRSGALGAVAIAGVLIAGGVVAFALKGRSTSPDPGAVTPSATPITASAPPSAPLASPEPAPPPVATAPAVVPIASAAPSVEPITAASTPAAPVRAPTPKPKPASTPVPATPAAPAAAAPVSPAIAAPAPPPPKKRNPLDIGLK